MNITLGTPKTRNRQKCQNCGVITLRAFCSRTCEETYYDFWRRYATSTIDVKVVARLQEMGLM